MNSNHVDKPTTITAAEFVEGYYDLKIKRKECSVFRDEDYQGEIADIFPYYIGSKDLVVVYSDGLSELSYVTGEEQLTVEWLAQPATTDRDDAEAEIKRLQAAYDQKVKEFDDYEWYKEDKLTEASAEIARLTAEVARLRKALEPFARAFENVTELDDNDSIVDDVMLEVWKVGDITAGDLIRAKIALANSEPDHR